MLSEQVKRYIPLIQECLHGQPVVKAWLFGSCSRGEETPDSDIDLLVQYDKSSTISLFTICGLRVTLKQILGRQTDVVEDECLLPFARESVDRDKILIYERKS